MKAQAMKTGLEIGGLADPGLVKALSAVEQSSRQVAEAGVKIAGIEMTGQLIDALA
jgi:hypothetical protein